MTRKRRLLLRWVVGMAMGLCAFWLATTSASSADDERRTDAPPADELFTAAEDCARVGSSSQRASALIARASARMERYAFESAGGAKALTELSEAQRCASRAGDQAQAEHAKQLLQQFRERVETDYRAHRARLRHALDTQCMDEARRASRALSLLLSNRKSAYTTWLEHIERGEP